MDISYHLNRTFSYPSGPKVLTLG